MYVLIRYISTYVHTTLFKKTRRKDRIHLNEVVPIINLANIYVGKKHSHSSILFFIYIHCICNSKSCCQHFYDNDIVMAVQIFSRLM